MWATPEPLASRSRTAPEPLASIFFIEPWESGKHTLEIQSFRNSSVECCVSRCRLPSITINRIFEKSALKCPVHTLEKARKLYGAKQFIVSDYDRMVTTINRSLVSEPSLACRRLPFVPLVPSVKRVLVRVS